MRLVDIGANLTHDSFDPDRDRVIARAAEAGVTALVVTGATEDGSRAALELARAWPGRLYATAGIHPHHARDVRLTTAAVLRGLATEPEVLAMGEMGLDFYRNFSPPDVQERVFEAQLEIACALNMPAFLHQRDAHGRFIEILARYRARLPRAVIHCFTGDRGELMECLELDLHVGITGWICDERRGAHLKDLVGEIPANRLMLETDAPYLLPRDLPAGGDFEPVHRRNEPAALPHICRAVAAARGESPEAVAAATRATACQFFAIPEVH